MSGLEDRLSLDISDALSAVSQLESAFVSSAKNIEEALQAAVSSFEIPDTTVNLEANVDDVTPSIDAAVAAADTELAVNADVTADTSQAEAAIQDLSGEEVEIPVVADTSQAEESLNALGGAGSHAAEGGHAATEQFALLGLAAKGAAGEIGAGSEALHLFGAGGAAAAGGIAALGVVTKELFSNAVDARSAEEQFNLILGEQAEIVKTINVGGLNEDLSELSVRLGATGKETEEAASKIFSLGTTSGKAAPEVGKTTEQVIALAARAVALRPQLGNVGDVAERLFSGLARGGRFAANFNLSLTAAEITARALADTGKATAADLTIYEKAAAGAALATEKLGDSLGTDIEEGTKNVAFSISSLKARFEEFLETAGQPLVDPIIHAFETLLPIAEKLAAAFADVLPPLIDVGNELLDSLGPAIDGLSPVVAALAQALEIVAGILDIIPGPLKTAVVGFIALNVALKAILATNLAGSIARLIPGISSLSAVAAPAAVALTATGLAMTFLRHEAQETDDAVQAFADSTIDIVNQTGDIEQLAEVIGQVHAKAQAERDAAAKNRGGFLGDFTTRGETRGFDEAGDALTSIGEAGDALILKARNLQREFGLTSAAALNLARQGDDAVESFRAQNEALDPYLRSLAAAEKATDEFWLAAQAGTLTAAEIQERATATGVAFDDLAKSVADARQPIVDFASQVAESLPGATEALQELEEKGKVSLQGFLDAFTQKTLEAAQFVGNIKELVARGAGDLATEIEKQGAEGGAALAAQAVRLTDAQLAKAEENVDRIHTIQANNAADLLKLNSDLNGGIQIRQQEAGEIIGKKLELIPGQVDAAETGRKIGENIATGTVNSIVESEKLNALPDDLAAIGVESGGALVAGVAKGVDEQTAALLDPVISRLKEETERILKNVFKISSPSKVTEEIGSLVAEGFIVGLADIESAADVIDPIIKKMDEFKLSAADVSKATGNSVDEIVASLDDLGKAQKEITPDELLDVGKAVKALGGTKGVKDLQTALAQQVSAAFGGLGGKEISDIVSKLNTGAAVNRVSSIFGVTPSVPKPFETNVVKGADSSTAASVIGQVNVTVTPPPEATPEEIAALTANAIGWQLQGVQ